MQAARHELNVHPEHEVLTAAYFASFVNITSIRSSISSDSDYGLVWKVQGYDDRFPAEYDLAVFDRIGVYGSLKRNNLHDNYMGACEYIVGICHLLGHVRARLRVT